MSQGYYEYLAGSLANLAGWYYYQPARWFLFRQSEFYEEQWLWSKMLINIYLFKSKYI